MMRKLVKLTRNWLSRLMKPVLCLGSCVRIRSVVHSSIHYLTHAQVVIADLQKQLTSAHQQTAAKTSECTALQSNLSAAEAELSRFKATIVPDFEKRLQAQTETVAARD